MCINVMGKYSKLFNRIIYNQEKAENLYYIDTENCISHLTLDIHSNDSQRVITRYIDNNKVPRYLIVDTKFNGRY